jgi:predicted ribosomally synthesized peptide with SipW-like signal peptide
VGAIVFVAAAAITASGAFFTDQEKSTGNTFTAGSLDLTIDSTAHYDGLICVNRDGFRWELDPAASSTQRADLIGQPCDGSWTQTNLGPTNKFFNISDIKPGDGGEDTISMHVTNNAWMCANITTTSNNDNDVTPPEIAAGDSASSTTGELAQNTFVFGWVDNASTSGAVPGDNKWQAGEQVLFGPTPLSAIVGSSSLVLPLADSQHGSPIIASTTNYVGVAWCTGTMNVSVPGTITCDGSTLGNIIQTDSATADITLTATQSRNNPNFLCGTSTATTTSQTITVTKVVVNNNGGTNVVSDFPLFVDGNPVTSGVPFTVTPGPHHISETGKAGYQATVTGDCAANGDVTVATSSSAACTITNDDIGPVITLIKHVNGGTATSTDFTMRVNGTVVPSGSSITVNANASTSITEDPHAGYAPHSPNSITGASCPANLGDNFSLGLAQSITCTVTNDAIQ